MLSINTCLHTCESILLVDPLDLVHAGHVAANDHSTLFFWQLQALRYRGETNKFKFENYINNHLKVHKMLVEAKYGINGLDLDDAIGIISTDQTR